jgi:hypothetical protein
MTFQACSKPFFTRAALEMHSSSPVSMPLGSIVFASRLTGPLFLTFAQPTPLWKIAIGGMN